MPRSPAPLLLLLALALAAAGCPPGQVGPADGGPDGGPPECAGRADCSEGLACSAEGRCVPCQSSGECLLREVCSPQTQACVARAGWGADCARNEDCQAGQWCRQGLCLARDQVRLCPSGASSECQKGQRCNALNLVCEEDLGCAQAGDCGAGEACNPGTRRCEPACTEETQGAVCAAGERCVGGRCAQCATAGDCAAGQACDAAGRCVSTPRCYSDRDCRVPLVCYEPTGACLEEPPPCASDEACTPAERCELGRGECVPRGCLADRYEPNGAREAASRVVPGRYEDLTLCGGELDFFALTLAQGDRLGVVLDADPYAEPTFTTLVQDASGRTVAVGRLAATHVAGAPGTYYVAVSSTDAAQPYDVSFLLSRGVPCQDDAYEPNDAAATATPLRSSLAPDGTVCAQDVDLFSLELPAATRLRAALGEYRSADGLLELCVLEGERVLQCTQALEAPQVEVPAAAAARALLLRVRGVGDRTQNVYTLQVELVPVSGVSP
jgi:hypothetical protein